MESDKKKAELIALAYCMIDFIDKDNPNTNDYNVLLFIARETVKRLKLGGELEDVMFTSKEILKGVVPNSEEMNPSNWLNQIFKKIDEKLKFEIEAPLSNYAAELGLNYFPWIHKSTSNGGKGHTSKYWLEPLSLVDTSSKPYKRFEIKEGEIRYTAVKEVDASFIAKLVFGKQLSTDGWRKWLMIFYPIITLISYVTFAYIIFIGWFINPSEITTRDLSLFISIILVIWFAKNTKESVERFTDDRVIMASEWYMKFKEFGVLQEMFTIKDKDNNFIRKDIRLVKYVSKCEICGSQIFLDRGEPDLPRRIVGRCKESPREHVYSFDRVTLIGKKLH